MFKGIIPFAHQLLEDTVNEGDIVIDATCGNGNDTLFLSELVGDSGHVIAFDIQKQAIEATKTLLEAKNRSNVEVIHDNHAKASSYIKTGADLIAGVIFNLGYLPRSDKKVITKGESTINAVDSLLPHLKKGACLVMVVYHGHEGGKEEKEAVMDYCQQLDQKKYEVITYQFINQKNRPPFVLAVQKK